MLYAVIAVSAIARGRVAFLDVARGEGASRRRRGDDARTTGRSSRRIPDAKTNPFMFRLDLLQNDRVRYAEPADRGGDRARRWRPRPRAPRCWRRATRVEPARVGLDDARELRAAGRRRRQSRRRRNAATSRPGSPAAATRIEATYETPAQYHNAMEPHAIVAALGRRSAVDRHAEPGPRAWRRGASPDCSASRRRTSISAARSSAAASAPRG